MVRNEFGKNISKLSFRALAIESNRREELSNVSLIEGGDMSMMETWKCDNINKLFVREAFINSS